jgi:hypothetical protein
VSDTLSKRSKFVVKKLLVGLDKPTSEALSELTKAIGGHNDTDTIRYCIRQMARAFHASEVALQGLPNPQDGSGQDPKTL